MREAALLLVVLFIVVFSYFAVEKTADFLTEIRRLSASGDRTDVNSIKIAAEIPTYFDSADSALAHCSCGSTYQKLTFRSGSVKKLLRGLSGGTIDIALLSEQHVDGLNQTFAYVRIPCRAERDISGETESDRCRSGAEEPVCAVWNKSISYKARDKAIYAMENEHFRLENGYCDYLD